MKQLGYVQDDTLTSAQALPSIPAGARFVLMQAESQNVRWRDDAVDPTTSVGMLLVAGSEPYLYSLGPLAKIRVIGVAGGAKLNLTYYR